MQRRSVLLSPLAVGLVGATPALAVARAANPSVDGAVALDAYQALVEEHLAGGLHAARALAMTSDAQSGEWARIKPALDRLSADLPTDATISYVQPDGSYATTASGQTTENLRDRDYFPHLLAGQDVVGSLVISKATGHRSVVVGTPVKRDGRVVAAIGLSLRARLISQLVTERCRIPAHMSFYALDAAGRTAIHEDPDRMFAFPSDMGDASLKTAVASILGGREGLVRYRYGGSNRTALFRYSEMTGWRFVLVWLDR